MSEDFDDAYSMEEPEPEPPQPRIPLIPWILVLLVVGLILNRNQIFPAAEPEEIAAPARNEPLLAESLAAKLYWGMQIASRVPASDVIKQLETPLQNQGPRGTIALAIVEASTVGSPAALKRLDAVGKTAEEAGLKPTFDIVQDWVKRRANDPLAPIGEQARKTLADQLGWFATIPGNAPPSPEDAEFWIREPLSYFGRLARFAMGIGMASLVVMGLILSGIVVFVALWVRGSKGPLGRGLSSPGELAISAPPILMETFAVWIVSYMVLSFGVSYWLVPATGMHGLMGGILVQILSLGAIAWPLARGVSLRELLGLIGLSRQDLSLREVPAGILGNLAFWPVMLVLLCFTAGLIQSFPNTPTPEHPLPMQLAKGTRFDWLLGVFAAVVMAPLVEEIFFRGFLYRHLRESSRGSGTRPSFWISTLISSVLFASIHPQGILGLPALGGLATLFCVLRETRNSLIAPMTAHAMVNGTTLLLLSLIDLS